jgi:hypothetical protein
MLLGTAEQRHATAATAVATVQSSCLSDLLELSNNDADAIAKPQVQAPTNSLNNPDGDSTSKTARDDSERTSNSEYSRDLSYHPRDSRGISSSFSDDRNFVHDPGGIIFNIKDVSPRGDDDGDDTSHSSSSSSSDDMSCNADAHCNFDRDRDKTVSSASEIDTFPLAFAQVNRPVDAPLRSAENPLAIPLAQSRCADVQRPPSLRRLEHPLDFCHSTSVFTYTPPATPYDTSSIGTTDDADNSSSPSECPDTSADSNSDSKCTDPATNSSSSNLNNAVNIVNAIVPAFSSNSSSNFNVVSTINSAGTLDNSSTDNLPIHIIRITAAHDDEPDHERVRISPLNTSHQVPPIAAP